MFALTAVRLLLVISLLILPPLWLTRTFSTDRKPWLSLLSDAGVLGVWLVLCLVLGMHVSRIPITALSLRMGLGILFVVSLIAFIVRGGMCRAMGTRREMLRYGWPLIVLILLLQPWTYFTGIDTYKWQDLATSMRLEASVPWLVHPLSLFGFTPRAYPPAHPVLLGTVQMVGGLGVDGGFAIVSALTALIGFVSATRLASQWFPFGSAVAVGYLYVFSPVFIRYSHWATGRGLFLALFPAFLTLFLEPIKADDRLSCAFVINMASRVMGLLAVGILLLMTHKVALVAVPLTVFAAVLSALLRFRIHLVASVLFVLCFLLLGVAMASPAGLPGVAGIPVGAVRTALVRFGWMLPLAVVGLCRMNAVTAKRSGFAERFVFFAALPALVLAFERQMYGALYALPFICLFAAVGMRTMLAICSARGGGWMLRIAALVVLMGALVMVVHRSSMACSPRLYRAAQYLEQYDAEGPFMVYAPGLARTRIQAYVSGCARFVVDGRGGGTIATASLPPLWHRDLRTTVDGWARVLRQLLSVQDLAIDWYGNPVADYYFVIDGQGTVPAHGESIYAREGITIYQVARLSGN